MPGQSVTLYKDSGYHFICFSERDVFTNFREQFSTETSIILPAVESSVILCRARGMNERYKVHHLHGILGTQAMRNAAPLGAYGHMQYIPPMKFFGERTGTQAVQGAADMLGDHGCVTTYNHPIQSRVTEEEFIHTEGINTLEIFNYNTIQESNTGYDVTYWDRTLRMGRRINTSTNDNNHDEGLFGDSCGNWICVRTLDLSHDNVVQNFVEGNYYSSSGPEIYDWGMKDGRVWIDASGVSHVNFVCGNIINDGTTVLGERFKDTLNHSKYTPRGHKTYIRVEAADKYGRTTWTNPIYLEW